MALSTSPQRNTFLQIVAAKVNVPNQRFFKNIKQDFRVPTKNKMSMVIYFFNNLDQVKAQTQKA